MKTEIQLMSEANDLLMEADKILLSVFLKTCQIKDRNYRTLINEHVKEAQYQIDDASSLLETHRPKS